MLTRKQAELLSYIDNEIRGTGVSPSFEEMKEALGLKSKSGVHRLISALVERGFLSRHVNRARALEVIRLPEGMKRGASVASTAPAVAAANDVGAVEIPYHGRIAAGAPIEALPGSRTIAVPSAILGSGEHYALEIAGDSMVEAGIMDGDVAIIRRESAARDGEIVVALVDDSAATLKYLRREGRMVRLDPANRSYDPQRYVPERVRVQGVLAGIFRRYG
jgi:repressor LexA